MPVMPLTLQDLYAHPRFIEKVEQPITAEIMRRKFQTQNPGAVEPLRASPIAVSLHPVQFSDEDEERIQGEVIVTAALRVRADIALSLKVRTAERTEEVTEDMNQEFTGSMNFSLPWSWQARTMDFVLESVQVALTELRPA
jgi:hypothetical protein